MTIAPTPGGGPATVMRSTRFCNGIGVPGGHHGTVQPLRHQQGSGGIGETAVSPPAVPVPSFDLRVSDGGARSLVLALTGTLDAEAAHFVVTAASVAAEDGARHLDIDLDGVQAFSHEGATIAMNGLRALRPKLADGISLHVTRPLARQAVLSAIKPAD